MASMTTSAPGNLPDAPNLQLRAALIARIQLLLASNDWTQQEAPRNTWLSARIRP